MHRIIAFILALVMTALCLSSCSLQLPDFLQELLPQETEPTSSTGSAAGDCIADQPKEAVDPLDISPQLQAALSGGLILSPNSAWVYANGVKALLEGAVPAFVEDVLLIPALSVSQLLNAQYTQNGSDYTITLGDITLTLTPGAAQLRSGDSVISLPMEIVPEKGDLLVSAAEFCGALGKSIALREDLIFIGDDVSAIEAAEGDSFSLVSSALQNELSADGGQLAALGAIPANAGYLDRADRSECLVLSADMIPYTSANGETIAVAGSLYVEDLKIEPSASRDNYYTCSMTVYNTGYTYGSVEAYSSDDTLVEFEIVKPFDGQKASVTKAITDVVVLGEDIAQAISDKSLAHLNYRSTLNSSISTIKLEVPADGYIFVTCNPNHSPQVAVYNAVHTFVTLANFAQDLVKNDDNATLKEKVTDYLAGQILDNAAAASEIAMEFVALFSGVSVDPWNPSAFSEEMGQKLLEMFQRCEFDIAGALKDAATDLASDKADEAVEAYLTKLLPATQAAFTAWDITYTSANLTCLFMDLVYTTDSRSVIIEIGDWRAAYAAFLRERGNNGGERFVLGYVNGDGIPDLMITYAMSHYGSYAEFYTYQKRQVVPILDEYGSQQLGVAYGTFYYAEFHSVLVRGNLHMGISSTNYMHIINNVITSTEVFYDTAQSGMGSEYYYNDEQVSKVYYNWKLNSFQSKYEDSIICVNGGSDGWSISEENIREQLKR